MSPDLGRFLQPDPIGFKGDASNLYRYCGNDWANKTDPMGLVGPGNNSPNDQPATGLKELARAIAEMNARLWHDGAGQIAKVNQQIAKVQQSMDASSNERASGQKSVQPRQGDSRHSEHGPATRGIRSPDYYQFSFHLPIPYPPLAWIGGQYNLTVNTQNGAVFVGSGLAVGIPANAGGLLTGNWIGNWRDNAPTAKTVSNAIKGVGVSVSGAAVGGGQKNWSPFGGPKSFGLGVGGKTIGGSATGNFEIYPHFLGSD